MPHIANLADDCDCCCPDDPFANAIGCAPHPPPNQTTNTDVIKPIPPSTSIQLCPPTLTVDCPNKRVGINTLTPTTTLDVNGSVKLQSIISPYKFGDVNFIAGSSGTTSVTSYVWNSTNLPPITNSIFCGELIVYIYNESSSRCQILMCALVKQSSSTAITVLNYQNVGNLTSSSFTSTTSIITLNINPTCNLFWMYRGT